MSYTEPTVDTFHARFPEFDAIDDELIEFALADASRRVDKSWKEGDYDTAIFFLAAHFVQTGNGAYETGGLRAVSLGSISVTYADNANGIGVNTTTYGTRYMELLIANKRGPRVA